jgi:hypothetical protein
MWTKSFKGNSPTISTQSANSSTNNRMKKNVKRQSFPNGFRFLKPGEEVVE